MERLVRIWRRLVFFFRRDQIDQDLAEEMRIHLEMKAVEKKEAGMSEKEARQAARREFGNAVLLREVSRETWALQWLETILQDIRYGTRTLAAHPGFTATAVLSLALGIGANTAIFSIINAVMLRSLPVEDPERLVQIKIGDSDEFTNPLWEQVKDHQQAFSGTLAYSQDGFDLAEGGESRFIQGLWVSGDFFRVLGVPALQGRVFNNEDDRRGGGSAGPVAVISYNFWRRNFQADSSIIGKTIRLNRHAFEIVGVTPPWFSGLDVDRGYEVAIPIGCEPILHTDHSSLNERSTWWLRILARVPPGKGIRQAEERMRAIAPEIFRATLPQDWEPQDQEEYLKNSFVLRPASTGFSATGERYRTALFTLMVIVGLVLLIACANIANLLLARAAARQREISVRLAIGASRRRVIRQLMTESLLLSLSGAIGGFVMALLGSRLLVGMLSTTGNPLEIDLSPDFHILAFTFGVAILTAVLFGLAPALRATRMGLNHVLRENAGGSIEGSTRINLGKALVTAQVALALVLLVGAGLFLGTLRNLLSVDPGFSRHNVLLVNMNIEQTSIPKTHRARTFQEILNRLRMVPGIQSAASSNLTPIGGSSWNQWTYPEGYASKSREETMVWFNRVSPEYFKTMGTPLLIGRDFDERDVLNSPRVMVINESTARYFFASANPIGKTIGLDHIGSPGMQDVYQVIGVVKDSKYGQIDEAPRRTAYLVCAQDPEPWPYIRYEVRSNGPVEALAPSIRSAITQVNRDISLEFRSFETQVNESLLQPRIVALLSSIFGSLALLLSIVGLYGITSYAAARRQREIGIRMALGAQPRSMMWLMLRDVVVLLAIGSAAGLAVSLGAGRLVASLLYGVRPNDPSHLVGAVVTLAATTAFAAYLPVRRAARLDPMSALREE